MTATRQISVTRPTSSLPSRGRPQTTAPFDDRVVDLVRCRATDAAGRNLGLTPSEFRLLRELVLRPNEVIDRESLRAALGRSGSPINDRAIDMLVRRLRGKIEPDPAAPRYLRAARGLGYLFCGTVQLDR